MALSTSGVDFNTSTGPNSRSDINRKDQSKKLPGDIANMESEIGRGFTEEVKGDDTLVSLLVKKLFKKNVGAYVDTMDTEPSEQKKPVPGKEE